MSVLDRLASALGRRDEQPNVALALDLAGSGDRAGIAMLADSLESGPRPIGADRKARLGPGRAGSPVRKRKTGPVLPPAP